MTQPQFPNPAEIALAIEKCEAILSDKKINKNKPFKEGYEECIYMLKDRLVNPENKFFLPDTEEEIEPLLEVYNEQMLPIKELKTVKGRTIAVLCNDWLNGQSSEQSFLLEMVGENDGVNDEVKS